MSLTTEPTFPGREACVSYGLPFPRLAAHHLSGLGRSRAYALISGSLSRDYPTDVDKLRAELGPKIVGERVGVRPHSDWNEILDVAREIYEIKPDIIVTLGGGSITDTTKILSLIDSNTPPDGEYSLEYLETLSGGREDSFINPAKIPIIAIPTTLSAGEYSSLAGAMDPRTSQKRLFHHPSIAPKVVILDPALAKMTPDWVWFSTGVRAIDHCVETIASSFSTPGANNAAARGLKNLISGLLRCKNGGSDDTSARLDAMIGARLSMTAVDAGIPMGGSHAIGHQLGAFGVPHGHTSCVMCPFVMRYNLPANSEQQALIVDLIWGIPEASHVLENRGLSKLGSDLCGVLDKLFRELGMPRSLKEVGIDPGENEVVLREIARKTLYGRWAKTNPRPLETEEQVTEILRMAV